MVTARTISRIPLVLQLVVSYAIAVGLWLVAIYIGDRSGSLFVFISLIALSLLNIWGALYYHGLLFYLRRSRKLCTLEMLFLSTNPRKNEVLELKPKPLSVYAFVFIWFPSSDASSVGPKRSVDQYHIS